MSGIAKSYAGSITSGGRFSVFGESDVVFPSNADYTPPSGDSGGYDVLSLIVSGLSAPGFNLILPLDKGRPWVIKNTNSVSFTVKGSSGAGVLVPANTILFVHCDGTKFEAASAAVDLTAPGPIGGTTASTIAFTDATGKTVTHKSPDGGTSGTLLCGCGDEIALSSDSAITLMTAITGLGAGQKASVDVIIDISKDGDIAGGRWKRTITCRNNSGTVVTPSGGTTDTDLSEPNNLATGVSSASSAIVISGTNILVQVTRPAGVPCHARLIAYMIGVTTPAA